MSSAETSRRRIAVLMPPEYHFARQTSLGAARYCTTHGVSMVHLGVPHGTKAADLRELDVDGAVAFDLNASTKSLLSRAGIPVVYTSSRDPEPRPMTVTCDNHAIGALGAAHLIERGLRNLAFVGFKGHQYSLEREQGFEKHARANGMVVQVSNEHFELSNLRRSALARWLRSLPTPVGILCCNDIRSRHVVELCRILGISIPFDAAILGVDNEEIICLASDVPLSSIDPDSFRIGYQAAALVIEAIDGKKVPTSRVIPPLGVVPRDSTATTACDDAVVSDALRIIHTRTDQRLGVTQLARELGQSRRTLERRFRLSLRRGVSEVLRHARLQRARQLLLDTDLSLSEVAEAAGFSDARQMRAVFRRLLKTSPLQVRETSRPSAVVQS